MNDSAVSWKESRKEKTRKAQTQQHRKTKKAQYRVRNWREYNAGLVQRGSVEVWVSEEVLEQWKPSVKGPRPRGGQRLYSDRAIECLHLLRAVFSLPLRATEGFGRSVLKLLDAKVQVPDYTTLCKRGKDLAVSQSVLVRGTAHLGGQYRFEGVRRRGMESQAAWVLEAPHLAQTALELQ